MLDGERELALVFGTHRAPALTRDTRVRVKEATQGLYILVVHLLNIVCAKMAMLHTN